MRRRPIGTGSILLLCVLWVCPSLARSITFEERVDAQETIERFYHDARKGSKRAFEDAVPRDALEAKVRRYLRESLALERYWQAPVTDEMLARETQRMVRDSREPERLARLFAALGDDPFLIEECLARQVLVRRLAENFYAGDARLHRETREQARELRARLAEVPAIEPIPPTSVQVWAVDDPLRPSATDGTVRVSADELQRIVDRMPTEVGRPGPVEERRGAFVVHRLDERSPGRVVVSSWIVAKTSRESWWASVAHELDPAEVPVVGRPGPPISLPSGVCPEPWSWEPDILRDRVVGYESHVKVWTGSEMLVWGIGLDDPQGVVQTYDPLIDIWTSLASGPAGDFFLPANDAVWTGTEMLFAVRDAATGYAPAVLTYAPASDSWTLSSAPPPELPTLSGFTTVWTGSELILWGGVVVETWEDSNLGARYDPSSDTWTMLPLIGAPPPRHGHAAVWAGDAMLILGGLSTSALGPGGRYDPVSDSWSSLPPAELEWPWPYRENHVAVWTGSEVILWGGTWDFDLQTITHNDGARFDPVTNAWTPMTQAGAPFGKRIWRSTWTGSELIVFYSEGDGGRYDPAADAWSSIAPGSPFSFIAPGAVWTGSEMIFWGFGPANNVGARYNPQADSWMPTPAGDGPLHRAGHNATWTGAELLVWGGTFAAPLGDGARWDPVLDDWSRIAKSGAPSPRQEHVALWTGDEMLLWGGTNDPDGVPLGDGARYDPALDAWSSMSSVGASQGRYETAAVWTGSEMLVWGGVSGATLIGSGSRYDPVSDSWAPITEEGAPSPRRGHSGVWTGEGMFVFGGFSVDQGYADTGGIYYPHTDTWVETETQGAPSRRFGHEAVWTGREAIVWAGVNSFPWDSGGRYDPSNDTWWTFQFSGQDHEHRRQAFDAIWSGTGLIAWGGYAPGSPFTQAFDTGELYRPATHELTPIGNTGAPRKRAHHAAVRADGAMLVWGGSGTTTLEGQHADGGRFHFDNDDDGLADVCDLCTDPDGDGFGDPFYVVNACAADNCPGTANADQADADSDGYGDVCDPCPADPGADPDADGCAGQDNCPNLFNPSQADADGDGVGTACDPCPVDPLNDADGDTVCGAVDNCPSVANVNQQDGDLDGFGLACDCSDGDPATFPGAGEVNDAADNQCPGDDGYGLIDEIGGTAGFFDPTDRDAFSWPAQPGASLYEVVRSPTPRFDGPGCVSFPSLSVPLLVDADPVPPDSAVYYLIRAESPNPGSWGAASDGAERTVPCL